MRMRSFSGPASLLLSFALLFTTRGVSADFPPVNSAELKITSVPNQPGAAAFILAHEEIDDDLLHFQSVYMRIKVLTEAGREHANIELPYNDRTFDIAAVHGRTIHADGTIIPFEGKPFEKVIVKGKDLRYKVKSFTMPDVQVGSIIEYRYEIRYNDNILIPPKWTLQETMYQQYVHYVFKPSDDDVLLAHGRIGHGHAWTWHTPRNEEPVKGKDKIEITLKDVPAFIEDDYMPPGDILKYYVYFYYQSARSSDEFWKDEGKFWNKDVEQFAKKSDAIAGELAQIVSPSDTPEQKVRKIYAYVGKLENTTYLPSRSDQEKKALGLKASKNASDVLRQKTGNRDEITRVFLAMVRQAGISAYSMIVTSRDNSFFMPQLMDFDQLDHEIAIVQLDGKDVFLDPGTRFCPYGMLYWKYSAARGLRQTPDLKGAAIAESALGSYSDANTTRTLKVKLNKNGQAEGTLQIKYEGQEALRRRLKAVKTDAAGRTKDLEDEVKAVLPGNAEVSLSNQPDFSSDGALIAEFKITAPVLISAGKRVLLPAHLLAASQPERFPHAERKYPVYFDYPYTESDDVYITLPPMLQVQSLPAPSKTTLEYAAYGNSYDQSNNQLLVRRKLIMNGNIFETQRYSELQNFYRATRASDTQQLLLKVSGNASGN
jgi:hypothetical protein